MIRWGIIAVLTVALAFTADRLVRVENQRYALFLGSCGDPVTVEGFRCLDEVQTRISWSWHLRYGLTIPLPAVPFP